MVDSLSHLVNRFIKGSTDLNVSLRLNNSKILEKYYQIDEDIELPVYERAIETKTNKQLSIKYNVELTLKPQLLNS